MIFKKTALAIALGLGLSFAAQADTLDDIRSAGMIKVAYREASIPFSYLDSQAKPTGFAWEISQKIVEAVKKELNMPTLTVRPQVVTSANRIPLIKNKTVDIECGSTSNNVTRAKEVAFSVNFFYTGTRFIVKTSSGIKTIADLKGKSVSSTSGTAPLMFTQKLNHEKKMGMRIVTANDHDVGFLNVQQGITDAFAMDEILIAGLRAASSKPNDFAIIGEPLNLDPYACMLRKDDAKFKAVVDKAIIDLMDSGEFEKMYKKWFLSSIPPKNVNLGLAMPAELKANLKKHSDAPADN